MKILVLGGAGYIGSLFVDQLTQRGSKCLVYDNLSRGFRDSIATSADFVLGDLADKNLLRETILEFDPDGIVHYAALALVKESQEDPNLYYQNNVVGTKNLLDILSNLPKKIPLVFSSTCAVYGNPTALPLTEDHPLNPVSTYGWSKLMCEQMISDYSTAYDMPTICIRYFNACGAELSGRLGERHEPETHLIPNILTNLALGKPIIIFGNDYQTPDGTCIRDYIHIQDLCDIHHTALTFLSKRKTGSFRVNCGTGRGFSNLEIVKAAEKIVGKGSEIEFLPRRDGDAVSLWSDVKYCQKLLEFSPKFSSLETILKSAWSWHSKNL